MLRVAKFNAGTGAHDSVPLKLGAADPADSIPVTNGAVANPSASFTRPATTPTYASGQLVANSATAGSVAYPALTVARVAGGSFMLRRLKLRKTSTGVTGASFRVHLFRAAPTFAAGDAATMSTSGAADYIGAFDVTIDRVFTDGACGFGVPVVGSEQTVRLASGTTIAWCLEARGAYPGVSGETITIELDDLQD